MNERRATEMNSLRDQSEENDDVGGDGNDLLNNTLHSSSTQ